MAKAAGNETKDRVTINGAVSNGAATHSSHHEDLLTTTVSRRIFRERPIRVTAKYRQELTILSSGSLSQSESVDSFLDFVAADRLRRVPHRGSRWDKILRWAEYFAIQISILHESVGSFVPNSADSAQLIWACCRILLQVGRRFHEHILNVY